jgi:hypothetical protein
MKDQITLSIKTKLFGLTILNYVFFGVMFIPNMLALFIDCLVYLVTATRFEMNLTHRLTEWCMLITKKIYSKELQLLGHNKIELKQFVYQTEPKYKVGQRLVYMDSDPYFDMPHDYNMVVAEEPYWYPYATHPKGGYWAYPIVGKANPSPEDLLLPYVENQKYYKLDPQFHQIPKI